MSDFKIVSLLNPGGVSFASGVLAASLSGNTAGVLADISSGTLYLAGGNNITLSQSIGGGGNEATVTIIGGAGAAFSGGISTGGNTTGDTGVVGNRLVLAGVSNITLSGSSNGGSATVSIIGPTLGAAPNHTIGMSNIGNTSGTTGVATGQTVSFAFVGGNNITLNQSLDGGTGTITISGANEVTTLTRFLNVIYGGSAVALTAMFTSPGFWVFPLHIMQPLFPGYMTANTFWFNMTGNVANSSSHTYTLSFGIYTSANSTALSLLYQATSTLGYTSGTDHSSAYNGQRFWSFHSSQFSNSASVATTPVFNPASYYYGALQWSNSNQTKAISMYAGSYMGVPGGQRFGTVGTSIETNLSMQYIPFAGMYRSSAFPVVMSRSSILLDAGIAVFVPVFEIENAISQM